MPDLIYFLNLVTFGWLSGWVIKSIQVLVRNQYHSILPVIILHWLCCGLPLLANITLGPPAYMFREGFKLATSDVETNIIYCIYVSLTPVFWWFTARSQSRKRLKIFSLPTVLSDNFYRKLGLLTCIIFIVLPVLLWAFSPRPELYFSYAVTVKKIFANTTERHFHRLINHACRLSAVGVAGFLTLREKKLNPLICLLLIPFISAAIWLNGKRNIVAMYIVMILSALLVKRHISNKQLVAIVLVVTISMGAFSYSYKSVIREKNITTVGQAAVYQDIREDYGRDDVIKTVIFAELNPHRLKILDSRGQTFLIHAGGFLIPRAIWEDKPLPFSRYILAASRLQPSLRTRSYGITTSMLAESIANFGWIGFLIGPAVIGFVCRLGDSVDSDFLVVLTTLLACLLCFLYPLPYLPLLYLWILLVALARRAKARRKKRASGLLLY